LRMGWIAQFLSRAVVTGFLFGAAIDVVIGELPKLTGTETTGSSPVRSCSAWRGPWTRPSRPYGRRHRLIVVFGPGGSHPGPRGPGIWSAAYWPHGCWTSTAWVRWSVPYREDCLVPASRRQAYVGSRRNRRGGGGSPRADWILTDRR
jgi:hypothetical protein